jgi:hypothetical protein
LTAPALFSRISYERRTFVKTSAVLSSGLLLTPPARLQAQPAGAGVVQVKGASPYEITKKAISEIGGMGKIVSRGDVVMVKPNIGWNRTVEQAACTNPEVLRAVIELAFAAGAKKVVVMDNTRHRPRTATSGIEAGQAAGADVRYSDENRLVVHDFKGEVSGKWPVSATTWKWTSSSTSRSSNHGSSG